MLILQNLIEQAIFLIKKNMSNKYIYFNDKSIMWFFFLVKKYVECIANSIATVNLTVR